MGSVPFADVLTYEEEEELRFMREAPTFDIGGAQARQRVTLARTECRRIGGRDTWIYKGESEPVDLYGRRRSVSVLVGGEAIVHSWWRLELLAEAKGRRWHNGMTITVAEQPWSTCWCRQAVLRPGANNGKEATVAAIAATVPAEDTLAWMHAVDNWSHDPFVTGQLVAGISDASSSLDLGSSKDQRAKLAYVLGVCADWERAMAETLAHPALQELKRRAIAGLLVDPNATATRRRSVTTDAERAKEVPLVPIELRNEGDVDRVLGLAVEQAMAGPPSPAAAQALEDKPIHVLAEQIAREHWSRERKIAWRSRTSATAATQPRSRRQGLEPDAEAIEQRLLDEPEFRRQVVAWLVERRGELDHDRNRDDAGDN